VRHQSLSAAFEACPGQPTPSVAEAVCRLLKHACSHAPACVPGSVTLPLVLAQLCLHAKLDMLPVPLLRLALDAGLVLGNVGARHARVQTLLHTAHASTGLSPEMPHDQQV
jgi:hypothetical protein